MVIVGDQWNMLDLGWGMPKWGTQAEAEHY